MWLGVEERVKLSALVSRAAVSGGEAGCLVVAVVRGLRRGWSCPCGCLEPRCQEAVCQLVSPR